jgi:sphinganine C4-monooxygenase
MSVKFRFVMDTWQYFLHRYFHTNKYLYRTVHSWHHRLYVPYAFGALYNHPVEGFVFDTLGGMIAHSCALMTVRQAVLFFAISTAKTVDDHCGFAFPYDPFQHLFGNNSDYHDIHRSLFLAYQSTRHLLMIARYR